MTVEMLDRTYMKTLLLATLIACAMPFHAQPFCGEEGVWIQFLGSGSLDLDNDRSAAGYLVWHDNKARVLVDVGPGTALRFDEAGADIADLQAIILTQNGVDHSADLPSLLAGSARTTRDQPLQLLGPAGTEGHVSVRDLVNRLIGASGAYPRLADILTFRSPTGYRLRVREVPSTGRRRWAGFRAENLLLSAVPVSHGEIPALAWRVDIADYALVFANDFSNNKDIVTGFAENADVIVFSHRLPDGSRGDALNFYVTPSKIGNIAKNANPRFIVLGSRGWRTFGRESQTMDTIKERYDGTQIYANDLECWGL